MRTRPRFQSNCMLTRADPSQKGAVKAGQHNVAVLALALLCERHEEIKQRVGRPLLPLLSPRPDHFCIAKDQTRPL